jgi:hypothetical protein
MNMRLMFATIAVLVFAPMFAIHSGVRPNLGVGSGYTSGWQVGAQLDAAEDSMRFECIASGADILRRAAPAINGTTRSPWAQRWTGLALAEQLVCINH